MSINQNEAPEGFYAAQPPFGPRIGICRSCHAIGTKVCTAQSPCHSKNRSDKREVILLRRN